MDKLSEKMGLYDLWAICFPGTIGILMIIFTYHIFQVLRKGCYRLISEDLCLPNDISGWIIFVLFSILFGIALQEFGRVIRRVFRLHNAAEGLLDSEKNIFSEREIADYYSALAEYGYGGNEKTVTESKRLFHCLNIKAQETGIAGKFVRLNILQNMSLSLAAAMLIEGIGFLAETIFFLLLKNMTGFFVTMPLCVLSTVYFFVFLKRYERFNRYWVRNIVFATLMREL